ncbi:right-handed parallel beta-helix repeat-containing protein [uncultured Winogradskyella sp.]|uniref:right-handed parallel beta-helix repeat-containing protein n=1 Tax=uncultured Winogradskyella sp. TaxID=395353 RepID=UPI0035163204
MTCIEFYPLQAQSIKLSSYGFKPDDNRANFYNALKNNDTLIVDRQNTEWLVSPMTFRGLNNKTIIFEEGTTLRAKPGAFPKTNHCLMRFVQCENIEIIGNNALLKMNKEEYIDGEWRMGISLVGCKNIKVNNLTVSSSGGDGIYIDGYKTQPYSENIYIDNVISTNNKRQGMSIISAKNVWVKNSIFTKTNGTLPEAGVDIEPDKDTNVIINVNFEHCSFIDNNHAGIVLGLNNLNEDSVPVSITFKDCYLSMNHDSSNRYPAAEIIVSSSSEQPVKGEVIFENIMIDGSEWGLMYTRKPSDAYSVIFKDLNAINICQRNEQSSVIYMEVPDYYKTSGPIGGFSLNDCYFEYDKEGPFLTVKGSSLGTLAGAKDITGNVTISNPKLTEFIKYVKYNPQKNINLNIDFSVKE